MRAKNTHPSRRAVTAVFTAGLLAAGMLPACEKRADLTDADTREMVELLMPQRIELVEAFTGFRSFDGDATPEGIEVLVRALDAFGDPVKIAGTIRFELYSFEQASGNRAGRRLCEPWDVTLVTQQDQKRYWNLVTGMYEVPLRFAADTSAADISAAAVSAATISAGSSAQPAAAGAGRKFVLEATYTTPLGTHMTDECVITAPTR